MGTPLHSQSVRNSGSPALRLASGVGGSLRDWTLNVWSLRLLPSRRCQKWIELEDSQPVSTGEWLTWCVGKSFHKSRVTEVLIIERKNRTNTFFFFSDSQTVINLKILRQRGSPELSGWAWCDHKGLYKRDTGEESQRRRQCHNRSSDWLA